MPIASACCHLTENFHIKPFFFTLSTQTTLLKQISANNDGDETTSAQMFLCPPIQCIYHRHSDWESENTPGISNNNVTPRGQYFPTLWIGTLCNYRTNDVRSNVGFSNDTKKQIAPSRRQSTPINFLSSLASSPVEHLLYRHCLLILNCMTVRLYNCINVTQRWLRTTIATNRGWLILVQWFSKSQRFCRHRFVITLIKGLYGAPPARANLPPIKSDVMWNLATTIIAATLITT